MSDTPRTDDDLWSFPGPMKVAGGINVYVHARTARQLERELNEANKRIELLESCNADLDRIAKERDDALDRIKRLEEAGDRLARFAEELHYDFWNATKEAKP